MLVVRVVSLLAAVLVFGCSNGSTDPGGTDVTGATSLRDSDADVVVEASQPAALATAPSGALLVGERLTGRVLAVPELFDGATPVFVTSVGVTGNDQDQRGLLGLAVDGDGRVFASYTRAADKRLVVAEIAAASADGSVAASGPGERRVVWEGPESAERANGGHIAFDPDGRLIIGVGDLLDSGRVDDPDAPNGKMLALRPEGSAEQRPVVLSAGWNNPFAFVFDGDGALWVADNAGPSGSERIGRGDVPGAPLKELRPADDQMAPSGLVVLSDGSLGVCGFLSGDVERVRLDGDRAVPTSEVAAEPCRLGAVALEGGRLVLAESSGVLVVSERAE